MPTVTDATALDAPETGRAVVAFDSGLLSGKFDSGNRPSNGVRAVNPLCLSECLRRAQPLIDRPREVAGPRDATAEALLEKVRGLRR